MRSLTAIVAITLLAAAFGLSNRSFAASYAPVNALPNCQGAPEVKPARITFACGDGNLYVSKIRWAHWGEQFANGVGMMSQNDCTPNCAAGHFHESPAMVVVAGQQTCPNGELAYNNVAYQPLVSGVPKLGKTTEWYYFACLKK